MEATEKTNMALMAILPAIFLLYQAGVFMISVP